MIALLGHWITLLLFNGIGDENLCGIVNVHTCETANWSWAWVGLRRRRSITRWDCVPWLSKRHIDGGDFKAPSILWELRRESEGHALNLFWGTHTSGEGRNAKKLWPSIRQDGITRRRLHLRDVMQSKIAANKFITRRRLWCRSSKDRDEDHVNRQEGGCYNRLFIRC